MESIKDITYAEALAEIEETLKRLRNEELSVDELADKVKRTTELIALCRNRLKSAEEDVKRILEQ